MAKPIMTTFVNRLRPDYGNYSKKLHHGFVRLWMDAIGAFVMKLASEDIIKVDTGMSKASLIPLAERLRMGRLLRLFIVGKRGPRRGYTDIQGVYHSKEWKSITHGERLGEKAFEIKTGGLGRLNLYFRFDIVVYQYGLQEYQWHSLEQGQNDFRSYILENWPRYVPSLSELFVKA